MFSLFTLPWMINQRKFTPVQFSVARKVTVSRFNLVFCSSECLCCLLLGVVMARNSVFLSPYNFKKKKSNAMKFSLSDRCCI